MAHYQNYPLLSLCWFPFVITASYTAGIKYKRLLLKQSVMFDFQHEKTHEKTPKLSAIQILWIQNCCLNDTVIHRMIQKYMFVTHIGCL